MSKFPVLNITFDISTPSGSISFELEFDLAVKGEKNKRQNHKRLKALLTYRCSQGVSDVTAISYGTASVEVVYLIPQCPTSPRHSIYRYPLVDVVKGLHVLSNTSPAFLRKVNYNDINLVSINAIVVSGGGQIYQAILMQEADFAFFIMAADWLVENQNAKSGGWSVPMKRQIVGNELELNSGWLNAMTQGQAMSLLIRAYKMTDNSKYAEAAINAVRPFQIPASQNGVVNKVFDKFTWFEEYPTTPGMFVLNGFIYSLLGLYDLSQCLPMNDHNYTKDLQELLDQSKDLYLTGIDTLKHTLPLFDTGNNNFLFYSFSHPKVSFETGYASFYDLRHISIPGAQPNIARWDYHEAHIRQLLLLSRIDPGNSDVWFKTAQRWLGYMHGHRAPHN